jgi:tetratricopeptide (TPR) repeat protein
VQVVSLSADLPEFFAVTDYPRALPPLSTAAVAVVVGVALSLALYWHTLDYPFTFDDFHNIRDNPGIRVTELTPDALVGAARSGSNRRRGVAKMTGALSSASGGMTPRAFRLPNLVIHGINAALVFALALHMARRWPRLLTRLPVRCEWVAATAALVWLLHPLQVQSVVYIVQRMNSLACGLGLLSALLYFHGRSRMGTAAWAAYGGAAAFWLLGIGCKETAVLLPALLVAIELLLPVGCWRPRIALSWPVAAIALAAAAIIIVLAPPLDGLEKPVFSEPMTVLQRLLSQPRVVVFYLSLFVLPLPTRLNLDHDIAHSSSLVAPLGTLAALLLLAGCVVVAWRCRVALPLVALALASLLIGLSLETSVLPLQLIFEHRMYQPMAFALPPLVLAAAAWAPRSRGFLALAAILLCTGLAWASSARSRVWADELTLWRDCMKKSPAKARPAGNVGQQLRRRGDLKGAEAALRESLARGPVFAPGIYLNLALVHRDRGNLDAAVVACEEALALPKVPQHAVHYSNIHVTCGQLLLKRRRPGDAAAAEAQFRAALALSEVQASVHNELGLALDRQGRAAAAEAAFRRAIALDGTLAVAHYNLGNLLATPRLAKWLEAEQSVRRALALAPDYADAHLALGNVFMRQDRFADAAPCYRAALSHNPRLLTAYNNLAYIEMKRENPAGAVKLYRQALSVDPNHAPILRALPVAERRAAAQRAAQP